MSEIFVEQMEDDHSHSESNESSDNDEGQQKKDESLTTVTGVNFTAEDVAKKVINKFGNPIEIESLGSVSKVIAARVVERLEEKEKRDEVLKDTENMWKENPEGTSVYCECCLRYSSDSNMPAKLKPYYKGHFGMFEKQNNNSYQFRRSLVNHVNHPVHIWCHSQFTRSEQMKADAKIKNEKACTVIVTNAAHVLKDPAGSANDFVKLNNKDQLLLDDKYPTKNDGKQNYFELRNVFYDMLANSIKEIIRDVSMIATTLDKVTVNGVSFTVICTYMFWKGGDS